MQPARRLTRLMFSKKPDCVKLPEQLQSSRVHEAEISVWGRGNHVGCEVLTAVVKKSSNGLHRSLTR
jgi:hypothetical protein